MTIKTYQPGVRVLLNKNIVRTAGVSQRTAGGSGVIDLTPFLGDYGSVTTNKNLNDPMGAFQIVLADQIERSAMDSLYGMIEPMDHIVIRMAREPHLFGGDLPVIMRGFVSKVSRSEAFGEDGRPIRTVRIAGNDYGKVFVNRQIFYLYDYNAAPVGTLQTSSLFEKFGIYPAEPAGSFMEKLLADANEYLDDIWASSASAEAFSIGADITVAGGTIGTFQMPAPGPVWNLMSSRADRPWNELFVEDRQDGPYLVYRPAPFVDLDGTLIQQPGAAETSEIGITDADVESVDISRDDRDVANFFWVDFDLHSELSSNTLLAGAFVASNPTVHDPGYQNNNKTFFGMRLMRVTSRHGWDDMRDLRGPVSTADKKAVTGLLTGWADIRREWLMKANRDNAVFESGTFKLKGNEQLNAGINLRLTRGALSSRYYINSVSHDFMPFRGYTTSVGVIRGTGFYERTKVAGSPYWAEGRRGPYDNG